MSDFKGCWVLALGTNDPANTSGNVEMQSARVDAMMATVGSDRTVWTTTKTRLDKGPYRNDTMKKWNQAGCKERSARFASSRDRVSQDGFAGCRLPGPLSSD